MNDALAPVAARYVRAVRSSANGQWRGRSSTFWLSLGLDRGIDAHVALVRDIFQTHGIVVSTSDGDLGQEPPDAWIELTATPSEPGRSMSIHDLPDALFGDALDPVDPRLDATVTATRHPEPPAGAVAPTEMHQPIGEMSPPDTTTSAIAALPSVSRRGDGSSDTDALGVCPSCGALVLLSASFCPVCDLPRPYLREGIQHRASTTRETFPHLQHRVSGEGRPPADTKRPRLTLPPGTSVVIGILVLSVGARLGNVLMPLLVLSAIAVLGVAVWKPNILTTMRGRDTSRSGQRFADVSVLQIAVVVAVIVAMYVITSRMAMVSLRGGSVIP